MERIELFGIGIDNVDMAGAVAAVRSFVEGRACAYVVTPNVDHLVKLRSDPEFRGIYADAGLVIADGMPLVWASKLAGKPLKGRVAGSDLFVELCAEAARTGMSVFMLGSASQDIIEAAARELEARYPGIRIVGKHSPSFGFEKRDQENEAIISMIRAARPDILFVGVGAPKQEKWIYRFRERLGVPVALGIGASFDFVAGSVKRAPLWMQKTGLEWFYRFIKEPRRMFKRYFVDDMAFLGMALEEIKRSRAERKAQSRRN